MPHRGAWTTFPPFRRSITPKPILLLERISSTPTTRHVLRYRLIVYSLDAIEQRPKVLLGLLDVRLPLTLQASASDPYHT